MSMVGGQTLESRERPAISELVREAFTTASEQRRHHRFPLFRPARIFLDHRKKASEIRGFTRDVSPIGVGLLHKSPVDLGPAQLVIQNVDGQDLSFDFQVAWCTACGGEWHLSAGRVEGASKSRTMDSLTSMATEMSVLRNSDRHSLFRPALICYGQGKSTIWGFARDVSAEGIGLLHDIPLELGPVVLTLSALDGREMQLRADIKWCQQCEQGLYVSGGQFVTQPAEGWPTVAAD